jgi:hypothetical protein
LVAFLTTGSTLASENLATATTEEGITTTSTPRPSLFVVVGISNVSMWKYVKGTAKPRKEVAGMPIARRLETTLYVLDRWLAKVSLPKVDLAFAKNMDAERKAKRAAVAAKIKKLVDERVAEPLANE